MKKRLLLISLLFMILGVLNAQQKPTVKADSVTHIQPTTAKGWGTVQSQGSSAVTERGICWSTSSNPLISGNHASSGSGLGSFSADMTGLAPNTTYYYRAYAINSVGVGYSGTKSFTTLPLYTITVSSNPYYGGSVTGGGTYNNGQTCTLTAIPANGYHFVNWTENGQVIQNVGTSYTFTVSSNRTLVANFEVSSYTITTNVNPTGTGTVEGGGTYNYNTSVILTANPNQGYSFFRWQDNNTQNPRTITVTGNATYTATFTQNQYTITTNVSPTGAGTVTGGGAFYYGDIVTLTAHPNNGYEFQGWNDGNTQNPRTITVTSNATYTAVFGVVSVTYYTVTASVNPEGAGTVTGTGTFQEGSTTNLTANANTGYTFNRWQDGNTQNPRPVTVNSNLSFTAYFTQNTYTISTIVNPTGAGTVTGGGNNFHYGDQTTLYAIANTGFTFDHWNDGTTQNPRQITVTGNATYTAYFIQNQYTITVSSNPIDGGSVTGGGTYYYGDQVSLVASPHQGYTFSQWQDGNTNSSRTITVTGNASYTAYFSVQQYIINTEVVPEGSGTVTGGGVYSYGEEVTLTATANEGYLFDHWSDGVATNPGTITVTGDATYSAVFTSIHYTITVYANPLEGGVVIGGGAFAYGEQCSIQAIPNAGYSFINWTENDEQVSSSSNFSFIVTGDRTLVANFAEESACIIFVDIDPVDAGTVTGMGPYVPGETCTLMAYAKPGYEFKNWTKNDQVISEEAIYSFTVTETEYYVAHFERKNYAIVVTSNPEEGGTITGDGQYYYGTYCTLRAMPNTGYTFVNWTDGNNTVISDEFIYTFQVTEDAYITANFTEIQQYTIRALASPENGGTVIGGGTYSYGAICTLTATPNLGYAFVNWRDGDNIIISNESTIMFQVMNDATYTATFFGQPIYMISATAGPNGNITPAGDILVDQGNDQIFTMTPDPGCSIAKVLIDGDDIGVFGSYTFTYTFINVNRNHTISVSFNGMGVEEAQALNVSIYPNPAIDIVYVEGEGIEKVTLFDMLGKRLCSKECNTSTELNVAGMPKGVYVLRLTTQDGRVGYQKLVLK